MKKKLSASITAQKEKKLNPSKWNNLLVMQLDNHISSFFISCSHPAVTPHCYKGSQMQENTLWVLCCHFSDVTVDGQYILQQVKCPLQEGKICITLSISISSPFPFFRRLNPKSIQITRLTWPCNICSKLQIHVRHEDSNDCDSCFQWFQADYSHTKACAELPCSGHKAN